MRRVPFDRSSLPTSAHDPTPRRRRPTRAPTRALRQGGLVVVGLAMVLATSAPVAATPSGGSATVDDTIPTWNGVATQVFSNAPNATPAGAGFSPGVAALHITMVHLAMYDAVVAIEGGYEPYVAFPSPPGARWASPSAAAATAAHDVITGVTTVPPLAPAVLARVEDDWATAIADAHQDDDASAVEAGIAIGRAAARALLDERADDGRFEPFTFSTSTAIGDWRPTPPGFGSAPFAWLGNVEPFVLEDPAQFRSRGPLPLSSRRYAREYHEVKTLGGPLDASLRTPAQEATAEFFQFDPAVAFYRIYRVESAERGLTMVEQARLFAMGITAAADASINCFNDKEYWSFWRPITAINEGDRDGNPWTAGDPEWVPRNITPPYPEHPSGYNCATAGFAHASEAFFGSGRVDVEFVKTVPDGPDQSRTYRHFRDIVDETIDARIYQGLHFRTADVQAAQMGRQVARYIDHHAFRPLP